MNRTIILTSIRERFSAPNRWFAAGVIFVLPILLTSMGGPPTRSPFLDVIFIYLIGAGIIGEEISTGTILLVLSRPVRRWHYVLSKWAALSVVTIGLLVLQALLGWALGAFAGHAPDAGGLAAATGGAVLRGLGAAAVLMPFSVAIAGGREISAIMLTYALGNLLELFGRMRQQPWMEIAGTVVTRFLLPTVDFTAAGSGLASVPGQIGVFILIVAGALTTAILLLERRELSYAGG